VARKLKCADRVLFQIVFPVFNDLIGGHIELCLALARGDFPAGERCCIFVIRFFEPNRRARFIAQVDAAGLSPARAFGRVVRRDPKEQRLSMASAAVIHG
jgi:hypothetical protein